MLKECGNVSMKITAFHVGVQRRLTCVLKIRYISFKCVFLSPSVSCNGFIPAVAFYQREHQSTRLTFNPKPGQVETDRHTHTLSHTYTQNKHAHGNTPSSARINIQKHKSKPRHKPVDCVNTVDCERKTG